MREQQKGAKTSFAVISAAYIVAHGISLPVCFLLLLSTLLFYCGDQQTSFFRLELLFILKVAFALIQRLQIKLRILDGEFN